MIHGTGDVRKQLAIAFGAAFLAAVGTELGKWGIELARRALKVEPRDAGS
jgi:hypothetical protein